jgi:hypothetical protein
LTNINDGGILRAMFRQFIVDTNNTNRTTRTDVVTGRWYLSGEQKQSIHPG